MLEFIILTFIFVIFIFIHLLIIQNIKLLKKYNSSVIIVIAGIPFYFVLTNLLNIYRSYYIVPIIIYFIYFIICSIYFIIGKSYESPTSKIVKILSASESGIKKKQILNSFKKEKIILSRLNDLKSSNFITINNNYIALTNKGIYLYKLLNIYRKIYNLNKNDN